LKKGEVRAMDEKVQKKREELVKKIEEALKGNSLEDQNAAVARAYSIIHKKYMVARGPVKK
jgi:5-methylcytosine-specific restriction endonuclease McrBC regulatory subunit McrC